MIRVKRWDRRLKGGEAEWRYEVSGQDHHGVEYAFVLSRAEAVRTYESLYFYDRMGARQSLVLIGHVALELSDGEVQALLEGLRRDLELP